MKLSQARYLWQCIQDYKPHWIATTQFSTPHPNQPTHKCTPILVMMLRFPLEKQIGKVENKKKKKYKKETEAKAAIE